MVPIPPSDSGPYVAQILFSFISRADQSEVRLDFVPKRRVRFLELVERKAANASCQFWLQHVGKCGSDRSRSTWSRGNCAKRTARSHSKVCPSKFSLFLWTSLGSGLPARNSASGCGTPTPS